MTGKHTTTQAVVLGLGSMFNHSTARPNVGWERDLSKTCMRYFALQDIRAGEELCINYGRFSFVDEDSHGYSFADEVDEAERLGRIELN